MDALPPESILVPTDLSDCAPGVIRHAADLAARLGSELIVLHAWQLPTGLGGGVQVAPGPDEAPISVAEHVRSGVEAKLPALLRIAEARGVPVRSLVVEGKPVDAILKTADSVDAHLIVMGTHGRRGLQRVLLGSVAEAVLRRAEIPVMTVRSRWHSGCEARSCATCTTHVLSESRSVAAELDG